MMKSRPDSTNNLYVSPEAASGCCTKLTENQTQTLRTIYVKEILLSVLIGLDCAAVSHIQKLADMLMATGSETGRSKYGLKENFAEDSKLRAMFHALGNLNRKQSEHISRLCSSPADSDFINRMADVADYTEECLDPIIGAFGKYVYFRCSRNLIQVPLDPVLLSSYIKAVIISDLPRILSEVLIKGSSRYGDIFDDHKFRRLLMVQMFNKMTQIIGYLDFHDNKGGILDFNPNCILLSHECTAFVDDIIYMLMSTEYINEIQMLKGGNRIAYDINGNSIIRSFDDCTLTIEGYRKKYENYKPGDFANQTSKLIS